MKSIHSTRVYVCALGCIVCVRFAPLGRCHFHIESTSASSSILSSCSHVYLFSLIEAQRSGVTNICIPFAHMRAHTNKQINIE